MSMPGTYSDQLTGNRMKSTRRYRQRQGSIVITLIGALIFSVVFFTMYCFKQWQINHRAGRMRVAQQAQKKPVLDHRWPSPDRRLAFKLPSPFSLGRSASKLVDHETGRVLVESNEGFIKRCKWRADSHACAVEYQGDSGQRDVVLLLIQGEQVTRCRPADVIEPDRYLPAGDRQLPLEWDHSVELGGFEANGDLQILWAGLGKLMRQGQPVARPGACANS